MITVSEDDFLEDQWAILQSESLDVGICGPPEVFRQQLGLLTESLEIFQGVYKSVPGRFYTVWYEVLNVPIEPLNRCFDDLLLLIKVLIYLLLLLLPVEHLLTYPTRQLGSLGLI